MYFFQYFTWTFYLKSQGISTSSPKNIMGKNHYQASTVHNHVNKALFDIDLISIERVRYLDSVLNEYGRNQKSFKWRFCKMNLWRLIFLQEAAQFLILMAKRKTAVSPVLMHWRYHSLVLSHWSILHKTHPHSYLTSVKNSILYCLY